MFLDSLSKLNDDTHSSLQSLSCELDNADSLYARISCLKRRFNPSYVPFVAHQALMSISLREFSVEVRFLHNVNATIVSTFSYLFSR